MRSRSAGRSSTRGAGCDVAIASDIEHVSVLAGGDFPTVERFGANRDGVASIERPAGAPRARRLAKGANAAGGPDGGQQRDRRDPAGARGGRTGARRRRPAACRCGAGAWQDVARYQGVGGRSSGGVGAQDRRSHGRRRADPRQRQAPRPRLPLRRRPGAQPARRHRECRRHCRVRRRGGGGRARPRRARRGGSSGLRQRLEAGLRAIWPDTIIFGENAPRGSPIRCNSRFPGSRRRPP